MYSTPRITHYEPGTWSHLWFAGVRECPPWCCIVGVTVHQFFCILHLNLSQLSYVFWLKWTAGFNFYSYCTALYLDAMLHVTVQSLCIYK